jgi:hypothetical protein
VTIWPGYICRPLDAMSSRLTIGVVGGNASYECGVSQPLISSENNKGRPVRQITNRNAVQPKLDHLCANVQARTLEFRRILCSLTGKLVGFSEAMRSSSWMRMNPSVIPPRSSEQGLCRPTAS